MAAADLKELAEDSLQLLKAAIHDERFPWLFHASVWGSLIGMFELNNLGAPTALPPLQALLPKQLSCHAATATPGWAGCVQHHHQGQHHH